MGCNALPDECCHGTGPSDGTVTVEETKSVHMTDFITVDAPHTSMMFSDAVGSQVVAFLRTGRFKLKAMSD